MKKSRILFLVLLFLMLLSIKMETVSAATGDRATPYSAWDNHRFTFQAYSFESPKVVEMQLKEMHTGKDANSIVKEENMFNQVPASDEEWIIMGFTLRYVSGPEEPLYATDVIGSYESLYTTNGLKISPKETASFSNKYEGHDEYDVELYPGGVSKVWYGILVKKTAGFPLVRVATGYDNFTYQTKYKWFSTNPSVASPTSMKAASGSYNSVKVSWTAVSGVSGYEIYRSTSSTGTFTKIAATTSTSYLNTSLNTGSTYYYKVRAYRTGTPTTYSSFSSLVSAKLIPATPTSAKAASSSYNGIRSIWAAVSGASGYQVYRATSSTGAYSLVGSTTSTSLNNVGLTTNKPYYYKVRAYRTVGSTTVYSNYSAVVNAKPIPSIPTNLKASRLSSTNIKMTWSSVSGASGYEIYKTTTVSGTYSLLKSTTSLYYTNSGLTTGRAYYYKLRAYRIVGTTKVYSSWATIISAKL